MPPEISVVVVSYDMQREAPRTVKSLLPPFQRAASDINYEVIVIDNGSPEPLSLPPVIEQDERVRLIHIAPEDAKVSPSSCVNAAVSEIATGQNLMICIDGARLPSSHLVRRTVDVLRQSPSAFVYAASRHLGDEKQMISTKNGYDQETEDQLLRSVDWEQDLDRLFEISVWAGSHESPNFLWQNESNAFSMSRELWDDLGGFQTSFERPGGGLLNLEFFSRSVLRPDAFNVLLHGEATFHQVHGGAATSDERYFHESLEEHAAIVGAEYSRPDYTFFAELGASYDRMNAVGRFLRG